MSQDIATPIDIRQRVAIVTGGAKGIGKAITETLSQGGAKVMIVDIDIATAAKLAHDLGRCGRQVEAIEADAASVGDASKVVEAAVEIFGGVDILVNNAGFYPFTPFLEVDEDCWDRVLDINLKSVFFYSQAAVRQMISDKKPGVIINLASVEAIRSIKHLSPYAAAKAGVVTLTKALALELGPHHIRVNAVAPGAIKTPGTKRMRQFLRKEVSRHPLAHRTFARHLQTLMATLPLGQEGEPNDVAQVVLFLASEAASYMTGSTVVVDGGFTLV